MKITELLKLKDFTISVELVPPRNGSDPAKIFSAIEKIKKIVDFVSVTKGAGGSLRGGTLPISYFAQEKYKLHTIAHFVCRERSSVEIENELIDMHYFGIQNILALRGDPPAGSSEDWSGEYNYAYLLVDQINKLNKGIYRPLAGKTKEREGLKTDFCIIVAGHPEDTIDEEIEHMKCKIDAGAQVIITQKIFSFEEYKNYVEGLRNAGINLPVIPGIRPLTEFKQVESTEKFFKLKVCDELKNGLKESGEKFGIKYNIDLIKKLKEYGAPGVHLFVLNDVNLVNQLLDGL